MADSARPGRISSAEELWALMAENERQRKESEAYLKALFEETRQQMKETDRKISNLGSRLGELMERLTAPGILKKFTDLGYRFERVAPHYQLYSGSGELMSEIDLWLEDGDLALAVEVKTKLTTGDVDDHRRRMEKLRRYADGKGGRRRLTGPWPEGSFRRK
ncbi:MAG: hypothetical protein LBQ35_07325 [Spirochaetaceae bacterium]|nr:hypothetical protein [Spirochaetaceae bacterium]